MGGSSKSSGKSNSKSNSYSKQVSDSFSLGENISFGQSTSGGYNYSGQISNNQQQSTGQSNGVSLNQSQSKTLDSTISNLQADVLQKREGLFDTWFMPNLNEAMGQNSAGSKEFNAQTELMNGQINNQFNAANKATQQTLAQQGLLGGGANGVNAALQAANNRARSSALAQAYFNQLSNAQNNKAQFLNLMSGQMAKPTGEVAYKNESTSNGLSLNNSQQQSTGTGTSASIGVGQQQSQSSQGSYGYQGSQSHSEGESTSKSTGHSSNSSQTTNMLGF